MKLLGFTLVFVALAAAGFPTAAQTQAPPSEETLRAMVEAVLRQYLDPSSTLSLSIDSVAESAGVVTVGSIVLTANPALIRGVQAEIMVQMAGVEFEPGTAAGSGTQLRLRKVGRAIIVARATAASIRDALASRFPIIQNPVLTFDAGQFIVTGRLRDGSQPAMLRGRFVVERGEVIRAIILEATVGGAPIPPQLVEAQLARFNPILDLSHSPIPLQVRLLALHNDRIEILAGID